MGLLSLCLIPCQYHTAFVTVGLYELVVAHRDASNVHVLLRTLEIEGFAFIILISLQFAPRHIKATAESLYFTNGLDLSSINHIILKQG